MTPLFQRKALQTSFITTCKEARHGSFILQFQVKSEAWNELKIPKHTHSMSTYSGCVFLCRTCVFHVRICDVLSNVPDQKHMPHACVSAVRHCFSSPISFLHFARCELCVFIWENSVVKKKHKEEKPKYQNIMFVCSLLGTRSLHFCRPHYVVAPNGPLAVYCKACAFVTT